MVVGIPPREASSRLVVFQVSIQCAVEHTSECSIRLEFQAIT